MQTDGLVAGEYYVALYWAFYGIKDQKHKQGNESLKKMAISAINCATIFRPGGPVYFASDSKVAVDAVKAYARTENRSISVLDGNEALHIDKFGSKKHRVSSSFYSVFVDLLLMANGNCVAFG